MNMPLLTKTDHYFGNVSLENTVIIGVQHILLSNARLIEYLVKNNNLKPGNIFLLGKSYSSEVDTVLKLKNIGAYIHPGSTSYNSHQSFNEQFSSSVQDFINSIRSKVTNTGEIIVLDSGGNIIPVLKKDNCFKIRGGIEQTTYGFRKIEGGELDFPVINVARSHSKLTLEAPFIGKSISDRIKRELKKRGKGGEKILIIGNGAIGSNIFKYLSELKGCEIYDTNDQNDNQTEFNKKLKNFDVIVGATGSQALTDEQQLLLTEGTILASASSSDIEFNSIKARRNIAQNTDPHKNIVFNGITHLNSGFPLNFTGEENENISDIQITRSLMMAGIFSILKDDNEPGINNLDRDFQEFLSKQI